MRLLLKSFPSITAFPRLFGSPPAAAEARAYGFPNLDRTPIKDGDGLVADIELCDFLFTYPKHGLFFLCDKVQLAVFIFSCGDALLHYLLAAYLYRCRVGEGFGLLFGNARAD